MGNFAYLWDTDGTPYLLSSLLAPGSGSYTFNVVYGIDSDGTLIRVVTSATSGGGITGHYLLTAYIPEPGAVPALTLACSWNVQGITLSLLRQITDLGFVVSVHRIGSSLFGQPGFTEMHAIDLRHNPAMQHIARVVAEDQECDYRCACVLAEMVGIRLEDG